MKAKVLSEKYQLGYSLNGHQVSEDVEYKDTYWRAFQIAGAHRCPVQILRIATVETPEEFNIYASFLDRVGDTCEVVTGQVTIDAEHFARDTSLSRYHPNNGWVVPEYVNDFEHALIV